MPAKSKSKTPYVVGVVIAVIIVSSLIPYKAWDYRVSNDRYCVEGQVASIEGSNLEINIDTVSGENEQPRPLGASVVLQGSVPSYCREGQSVIISIYSGESLFEKIDKEVEVQLYRDTNVLMGLILPMVAPFQASAPSMKLIDIDPNGTLLVYYRTEGR